MKGSDPMKKQIFFNLKIKICVFIVTKYAFKYCKCEVGMSSSSCDTSVKLFCALFYISCHYSNLICFPKKCNNYIVSTNAHTCRQWRWGLCCHACSTFYQCLNCSKDRDTQSAELAGALLTLFVAWNVTQSVRSSWN